MKKINIMLFAFVLGFMLIAGQPHAVVANSSSSDGASLDFFDSSDADYSVVITEVSPGPGADPLDVQSDGTYHLVSNQNINTIRVNANISGYTLWNNLLVGNSTHNGTFSNLPYAGELYTIVNGDVTLSSASLFSGTAPVDITLGANFNVITFLYMGRDQAGNLKIASDTIVVRIAAVQTFLETFNAVEIPFSSSASDRATTNNNQLNISGVYTNYGGTDRSVLDVGQDITVTHTNEYGNKVSLSATGILDIVTNVNGTGSIAVTGNFDTSGFRGLPVGSDLVDRTSGYSFVQDATGLELIGDKETVKVLTSTGTGDVFSTFSIVSFADFGYGNLFYSGVDMDGRVGSSALPVGAGNSINMTAADALIAEASGYEGGFYGSTDFIYESFTVNVQGAGQPGSVQTQTVEGPGFQIAAAFIAVGIVAYIAPRVRKE